MAQMPLPISSNIVQASRMLQEERRSYVIYHAMLILPHPYTTNPFRTSLQRLVATEFWWYAAPLPDLRVGASWVEACGRVDLYCAWRLARASSTAMCFDTVFSWEGGDMIEAHKEANKSIVSPITSSDAHYALARFAGL